MVARPPVAHSAMGGSEAAKSPVASVPARSSPRRRRAWATIQVTSAAPQRAEESRDQNVTSRPARSNSESQTTQRKFE